MDRKKSEAAPGPGHHTQSYSSFSNTKVTANFASGRKESRNNNPGPGQYDSPDTKLVSKGGVSQRFNQTARPDIWEKGTKNDIPGPGLYVDDRNTFGKAAKGTANMGSKYKPARNENPGPGQYNSHHDGLTKQASAKVKLNQAARQDIWAE